MRTLTVVPLAASIILAGCLHRPPVEVPQPVNLLVPRADHHAHLTSFDDWVYAVAVFARVGRRPPLEAGQTAIDLIASLDSAHVLKATVLSTAYFFGAPDMVLNSARDEYTVVRGENNWVAAQVAQFPNRLIGFCAVNPLREYASREIARCNSVGLRGLKLHFANSRIDLTKPDQVQRVRDVFAAANAVRFPIVAHIRTGVQYGASDARIFIEKILPAAPDVTVQLAHLAGWGSYDEANDEALGAFIDAMTSGEIDRSHLYFDLAAVFSVVSGGVVTGPMTSSWTPVIARRMREIGLDHVLFATDWAAGSQSALAAFLLNESGLTRKEVRRVFDNLAPYLK
jgi:predicted TIM-barrel fold metal-dependent hydrolase